MTPRRRWQAMWTTKDSVSKVWVNGTAVRPPQATTSELLAKKPLGTAQTYPVTPDRAWKIARAIVDTTAAFAVEEWREDGKDGVLIATTEAHDWHVTTKFAIWIEPVEAGTRLIVLSRTVRPGAFPRALAEKEFQRDFAQRVVDGLDPRGPKGK
jgi:hypothetical protein